MWSIIKVTRRDTNINKLIIIIGLTIIIRPPHKNNNKLTFNSALSVHRMLSSYSGSLSAMFNWYSGFSHFIYRNQSTETWNRCKTSQTCRLYVGILAQYADWLFDWLMPKIAPHRSTQGKPPLHHCQQLLLGFRQLMYCDIMLLL